MTAEELERTIEKREMSRLELKESFGAECIETACAFANAAGGYVVIGVDDCGEPSKNQLRAEGLRDYENRISTVTEPSVAVDAEKVPFDAPMEVIMNPDHRSHPRNRLIAQIFFDMGIIEQYGSGIERIKRECMKNGSPFPEWKEAEGGFLTTYQIQDKKVEVLAQVENQYQSSVESERAGEISGGALKVALKVALKTALKDDNDEIVAKILAVYKEIANDTTISLSAVAEKVGLSPRTVDEYVGIMKSAKVLRRKGGRKFGEWEILTK